MATARRAKDGLAIRVDAAHQRRSRATMVPIKTRTNRMLKDRAVLRLRHNYSANCVSGGISRSSFMQRCCRGFGLRAVRLLVTRANHYHLMRKIALRVTSETRACYGPSLEHQSKVQLALLSGRWLLICHPANMRIHSATCMAGS